MSGDELWVWQEYDGGGWGLIVALVPALGVAGPLSSRSAEGAELHREAAMRHAMTYRSPVRLAHFTLTETVSTIGPA